MKLLYGTTNQAKLTSMQRVTKKIGIEIFGLNDLQNIPEFKNITLDNIVCNGAVLQDHLASADADGAAVLICIGIACTGTGEGGLV